MKICRTSITPNSLAEKSFNRTDYADAYTCGFTSNRQFAVEDLVLAFFKSSTNFGAVLMKLRNSLMKPFGIKVTTEKNGREQRENFTVTPGKAIGLFKVFAVNNNEVLMGEDDKHVNFRISFLLLEEDKSAYTYTFTLSTVVLINNRFGRLYFFPVKFFHKLIVAAMMRNMIKNIKSKE